MTPPRKSDDAVIGSRVSDRASMTSSRSRRRPSSSASCWRRLPRPSPQLLFAVVWFLLAAYINSVVQAILQRTVQSVGQTLPDVGFATLQQFLPPDAFYADLALFLLDGTAFARFLISSRWRSIFLRRRLLTQGVVFLLRAVSIAVTPLPNPYPQCRAGAGTDRPAGVLAVLIMTGLAKTCNDVMFSGHAASMTLSALFLIWHCDLAWCAAAYPPSERYLRPLTIAMKSLTAMAWMMGLLVVIATRFHYTLDVFIGAVIAAAVFLHYYALVALVRLLHEEVVREHPNEISFGIIRFISWFERVTKSPQSIGNHV